LHAMRQQLPQPLPQHESCISNGSKHAMLRHKTKLAGSAQYAIGQCASISNRDTAMCMHAICMPP
jgi:hypothetical protein